MANKSKIENGIEQEQLKDRKDLNAYLLRIKDRLTDKTLAPVHALSAMKWVLSQPNIYALLNADNKELARDVWLRVRQSGVQVKNPPLLFSADEEDLVNLAG
jgi:hypothetical protein